MKKQIAVAVLVVACACGSGFVPALATTAHAEDASMNSDQPITDTWITTKVKAELATTDGVKSTDISVKTVDGKVILIGVLPTQAALDKAVAATRQVKGVKAIDDSGLKVK
ncbi:BON domain-containing protein [Dokdonella fugitiva]|uniref:BON domain-containing protein n=1 Tax=Dokdonella fugitiva TaxID=328517 RepID=UPI0015FD321B|nr:BON domain-containing protein [Dokdonella fugitiva]MBA8884497.1 hyperosmotically inducible protein [Dokdonella fugitiva]